MSNNFAVRLLPIRFSRLNHHRFPVRIPFMNIPKLGKLEEIKNLREVWTHEAREFTTWLAREGSDRADREEQRADGAAD